MSSRWPGRRLRRLFKVVPGGTPTADALNWGGGVTWVTPADLAGVDGRVVVESARTLSAMGLESGSRGVPADCLVLSTRAPIGYVARTAGFTAFNQGCRGLVPTTQLDIRYMQYQLGSMTRELQSLGQGSTFTELTTDNLASCPLLVPSQEEQRAVADFLDVETYRIDGLISRKRRLMGLLEERLPVAAQEVLAEVMRHSKPVRLKAVLRAVDERRGDRVELPLLSVSIHRGVVLRESMTKDLPRADDLSIYKRCRAGDIVLNRMRAFQGAVGLSAQEGIVSTDYMVLRPRTGYDGRFLHDLFRSPRFVGEMTARLRGIGTSEQGNVRTPRVNVEDLLDIRERIPAESTQRDIAEKLDAVTDAAAQLSVRLSDQIALLVEHRQALITAAVTGGMDIPGVAA